MKRYIQASTREDLMDEVDRLYDYATEYCDERVVEGILLDNGASEDDEGPDGFLTGVTESQLRNMISELQNLIDSTSDKYEYQVALNEDEISIILQALRGLRVNSNEQIKIVKSLEAKLSYYDSLMIEME